MDLPATQICDDNDYTPTQKICHATPHEVQEEVEIGVLCVGSNRYPIKKGINQIGRHPNCSVILNDQTVSKKHAEIEANSQETSAWICDLNSSNTTKLNNSVLRPGRCYELKDGNTVDFGMVQAIYKVHRTMDESLIPETPLLNRQRKGITVIPGTPDSSLNNSSALGDNSSIIPGTQADNVESMFRYPTLPVSVSTSSTRKSGVRDSSIDNSTAGARRSFSGGKENVGEQKTSIYDMETQNAFEYDDEPNVDIHDVETQKICLRELKSPVMAAREQTANIHDMETQHELEEDGKVTDIHNVETQHEVDIHDVKTPKNLNDQREVSENINPRAVVKFETPGSSEEKGVTGEKSDDTDTKEIAVNEGASCSKDTDKLESATERAESIQESSRGSQECLEVPVATDFEDEPSGLNRSRNLLGSQNLIDFIDDNESSDESKSVSVTGITASHTGEDKDANEKSTDDENIFEAATQRIQLPIKAPAVVDDSDDTDDECIFQRYSHKDSQDTQKTSRSHESDSDSVTDEEGQFMDIALKKGKSASSSFEMRRDAGKDAKDSTVSSKESDDLFDMLTQPTKSKNEDSPRKQSKAANNSCIDFDEPTQVMNVGDNENDLKINDDTEREETDYIAPTQVLATPGPSTSLNRSQVDSDPDDITEMEDNVATQILSGGEKTEDRVLSESPKLLILNVAEECSVEDRVLSESPKLLILNVAEECSVEDIDYELAPTQLASEIVANKPASSSPCKSETTAKVDLDDSIEQNLHEMFDDVTDQRIEELPQMSTQILETVLQSECNGQLPTENQEKDIEGESSTDSVPKKSRRRRKSKSALVPSPSNSVSKKSQELDATSVNTDKDSQSSENYFSSLTSARKRNIIADSQDSADPVEELRNQPAEEEQTYTKITNTTNNEINNSCDTPLKSTPRGSSTPRPISEVPSTPTSSRKNNIGRTEAITTPEKTHTDKNETDEASRNVNSLVPSASADGEQLQRLSTVLDDDDEDILAGLPEVRISGTLSNPASPTTSTTSEYKINVNTNRSKQVSVMIAPKKRAAARKTARKSIVPSIAEDVEPCLTLGKPNTFLESLSSSFSDNLDVDKIAVQENGNGGMNKRSRSSVRTTMAGNTRRSKGTDSVLQLQLDVPVDSGETAKPSPSIRRNGRTRSSRKENVHCSSVFQVGTDPPFEIAATEPVKTNVLNASRVGKRSLSMTDAFEISDAKKRKTDAGKGEIVVARGIKQNGVISRPQSANTFDNIYKRRPGDAFDSGDVKLVFDGKSIIQEAVVNIVRLSPCIPTGPGRKSRRSNVASGEEDSNASTRENEETVPKIGIQKSTNQRTRRKIEQKAEEISSEIGQESQEVEMIMNGSLVEQVNSKVETKVEVSGSEEGKKTRNTRKRANAKVEVDVDISKSSASSDIGEPESAHFEVPTSKAKRTRVPRNTSNVTNTTMNESAETTSKNSRQSSRTTRGKKSTANFSVVENTDSTIEETSLDNTANRTNNPRAKRQRKARKVESDKDQEDTTFSDTNTSVETSSVLSTPNRLRRSASSFGSSTPSKIKHKILFTGISSNEYSKLLTKLGASQVEDPAKCTVLVTDKVRRTVKFLCALAQSIPIVSIDWLVASEKAGHFVELEDHILKDPAAENKFRFKLEESLNKSKEHKLLEGYTIVLTPNIPAPPLPELKSIIGACSGKALVRAPSSWPQKTVIVSHQEDFANAKKFLAKAPKTVTVQSTEFILTGILRQLLDFTEFLLK